MQNIFTQHAERGHIIIAEQAEGVPFEYYKWGAIYELGEPPTPETIEYWIKNKARNYGLVTGNPSKLIALDFDYDPEGEHDALYKMAGHSPVVKIGSKGFTAIYRHNAEINHVWKREKQTIIELLSTGRKTTIPPSMHWKGHAYTWQGASLFDTPIEDIPYLPTNFCTRMDAYFGVERSPAFKHDYNGDKIPASELQAILGCITLPMNYEDWLGVCMAARYEFGDGALSAVNNWSAGYNPADKKKRHDTRGFHSKWRGFDREGYAMGTLLHFAHGYERPISFYTPPADTITPQNKGVMPTRQENPLSPSLIPGGILKDMVDWILSCSPYPQPELALGASIAALGMLMGQRYSTQTNLRTNFYCMGLASSGGGKEHARKCISMLFHALGLEKSIGGAPASGPGVFSAVHKSDGIKLLMIDEIGRFLRATGGTNSASHEKTINTEIIEFFSRADTHHISREYANQAEKPTITIEQPCLCVYGTTIPENFTDALNSRDAIDGFLSRWLIFSSRELFPKWDRSAARIKVPATLVDKIEKMRNTIVKNGQNKLNVVEVPFSSQALTRYEQHRDETDARREPQTSSIVSRIVEHTCKMSLAAWAGNTDDITIEQYNWAASVAEFCVEASLEISRTGIVENEFDKQCKRVIAKLERAPGKKLQRQFITRDMHMPPKLVEDILRKLHEDGIIDWQKDKRPQWVILLPRT